MTTSADAQTLLLQVLDPSNRANPYPLYEQLREHSPLFMSETNLTVFASFRDCDDILRHPASASE